MDSLQLPVSMKENLLISPRGSKAFTSSFKSPLRKKRSRTGPLQELSPLPGLCTALEIAEHNDFLGPDGIVGSPDRHFSTMLDQRATPAGFLASPLRNRPGKKIRCELKTEEDITFPLTLPDLTRSESAPVTRPHKNNIYIYRNNDDESPDATLLSVDASHRPLVQPVDDALDAEERSINLDAPDADVKWSKLFMGLVRRKNRREELRTSRKRKSVCRSISFNDVPKPVTPIEASDPDDNSVLETSELDE
ncbi:hypothetical protein AAMO2058_000268300 [Amorphochlora amoebiformis]